MKKKINRRISSVLRDNLVHDVFAEEMAKLGEVGFYVAKEYLYNKVKERLGLSIRSISYIINHTRKKELLEIE